MTSAPTPIPELGARAKAAAPALAAASTETKDDALRSAAELLVERADELVSANEGDVARAETDGVSSTLIERLRLTPARVEAMADGLTQVASLPDPVGRVVDGWTRPNGIQISRVRVPLGVVAIIYESRPNVTSDAAGLCLKSGNVAFLRGSSTAIDSNLAIAATLREGFAKAGLPEDALVLVDDTSRESAVEFMQQRDVVDCLIPRGGPSLIASILEHATVPYVIDGAGNCHLYVDASADLDMALDIIVNAKTQRPSVCNSLESLLVHDAVADEMLARVENALEGVELLGDERTRSVITTAALATDEDYATEFLDLRMSIKVVDTIDEAIEHITRFGTGHSETIITNDLAASERFTSEVDAAAVLVNASSRFVDGEEFGFGAEIGISTQKLHARGPMGLEQLTTAKFIVRGNGQTR